MRVLQFRNLSNFITGSYLPRKLINRQYSYTVSLTVKSIVSWAYKLHLSIFLISNILRIQSRSLRIKLLDQIEKLALMYGHNKTILSQFPSRPIIKFEFSPSGLWLSWKVARWKFVECSASWRGLLHELQSKRGWSVDFDSSSHCQIKWIW